MISIFGWILRRKKNSSLNNDEYAEIILYKIGIAAFVFDIILILLDCFKLHETSPCYTGILLLILSLYTGKIRVTRWGTTSNKERKGEYFVFTYLIFTLVVFMAERTMFFLNQFLTVPALRVPNELINTAIGMSTLLLVNYIIKRWNQIEMQKKNCTCGKE